MVVEDEILIRHDISGFLRSAGFEVIEANSATEAIQVLKDSLKVSLVFTDVRMPGTVDGIDLARYVQLHHPDIPVLITSDPEGISVNNDERPKDLHGRGTTGLGSRPSRPALSPFRK